MDLTGKRATFEAFDGVTKTGRVIRECSGGDCWVIETDGDNAQYQVRMGWVTVGEDAEPQNLDSLIATVDDVLARLEAVEVAIKGDRALPAETPAAEPPAAQNAPTSFAVGDRVRIVAGYHKGDVGTVIGMDGVEYQVTFPGMFVVKGMWYMPEELVPAETHAGGELEAARPFQATLDEIAAVSEANREAEEEDTAEREHAAIVTILSGAYTGDFIGADAERVIRYIDKLRGGNK